MRFLVFSIVLLTISEPLLILASKVVLVIPQQTRRSLGPPLRPVPSRYRKSSHEGYYHKYRGPPSYYHKKSVYDTPPFPHGGDDFDQGHEHVNHIHLPYGKGISHAISYGKGYIPYDQIKGGFSLGRERHPGIQPHEYKQSEPDYESTSYTSSNADYSPSGQGYESSSESGTYYSNPETALNYNERRNDAKKFYSSRSIEKDLSVNQVGELNGVGNKDELLLLQQKVSDMYNNISPHPQGGITLPSGIPPATIGGSKEGIVLRDSVALDEYQQKLQEMTNSWPQFLPNTASSAISAFGTGYQNQQPTIAYTPTGQTSNLNWSLNFAQPKQGYDVKEDTMEPPPDFRNSPIQTNPYQSYSIPMNMPFSQVIQTVHG